MSAPGSTTAAPATAERLKELEAEVERVRAALAGAPGQKEPAQEGAKEEPQVTPWEAAGNINYDKLIKEFGCERIDENVLARMERLINRDTKEGEPRKKLHRFLRRGIFFSHRDLNILLDKYEKGEPFYLYTGRGPSSDSMHVGHLVPFMFTKWFQEAFDVPLVIQMTDDEKILFRGIALNEMEKMTKGNVKEILSCGYTPEKTFIFSDLAYMGKLYPNVVRIQSRVNANTAKAIFGFTKEDNIGKWAFPAVQAAPSFSSSFPHMFDPKKQYFCLIPQAIDQDPYFRMTRAAAQKLGLLKPALIHSVFFPALGGPNSKMSASIESSAIFLKDTPKQVQKKLGGAFSCGGGYLVDHYEFGGDPTRDVPSQWLKFLLEDDDLLAELHLKFRTGELPCGALKKVLADEINKLLKSLEDTSKALAKDAVDVIMAERNMRAACAGKKPTPVPTADAAAAASAPAPAASAAPASQE